MCVSMCMWCVYVCCVCEHRCNHGVGVCMCGMSVRVACMHVVCAVVCGRCSAPLLGPLALLHPLLYCSLGCHPRMRRPQDWTVSPEHLRSGDKECKLLCLVGRCLVACPSPGLLRYSYPPLLRTSLGLASPAAHCADMQGSGPWPGTAGAPSSSWRKRLCVLSSRTQRGWAQ